MKARVLRGFALNGDFYLSYDVGSEQESGRLPSLSALAVAHAQLDDSVVTLYTFKLSFYGIDLLFGFLLSEIFLVL
jgi:hypothetical protein